MSSIKLPLWNPQQPPIYDIQKTYLENVENGPFFNAKIPARAFPPKEQWIDFLGHPVASPIGVPAGPLLTARWVKLAADLGFDILTYKTIRSGEHPAHPLPNMVYVDTHGTLSTAAHLIRHPSLHLEDLAVTNSFGMPSKSPDFLREDIPKAKRALKEGQVMIVSVVGTPRPDRTFLQDFLDAAMLAKDSEAQIIEANFSCPNVDQKAGCLYMNPNVVHDIGSALVKAIHPLPLIIKVGVFASKEQLSDVMNTAARAGIRGFCGINTISMRVVDEKGDPALGPNRTSSGICGGPIRSCALQFLKDAHAINQKDKLDLALLGCGGITLPEHFDAFLSAGADIAMTATGMMWDPYLAARYHTSHLTNASFG